MATGIHSRRGDQREVTAIGDEVVHVQFARSLATLLHGLRNSFRVKVDFALRSSSRSKYEAWCGVE
jgi:hypothetical protein